MKKTLFLSILVGSAALGASANALEPADAPANATAEADTASRVTNSNDIQRTVRVSGRTVRMKPVGNGFYFNRLYGYWSPKYGWWDQYNQCWISPRHNPPRSHGIVGDEFEKPPGLRPDSTLSPESYGSCTRK